MAAPAVYKAGAAPPGWEGPPPEDFGERADDGSAAVAWLDLCAWVDVHFPPAQHEIGLRVSKGRDGAKHDLPLAFDWLRKASVQGYVPAVVDAAPNSKAWAGPATHSRTSVDTRALNGDSGMLGSGRYGACS